MLVSACLVSQDGQGPQERMALSHPAFCAGGFPRASYCSQESPSDFPSTLFQRRAGWGVKMAPFYPVPHSFSDIPCATSFSALLGICRESSALRWLPSPDTFKLSLPCKSISPAPSALQLPNSSMFDLLWTLSHSFSCHHFHCVLGHGEDEWVLILLCLTVS